MTREEALPIFTKFLESRASSYYHFTRNLREYRDRTLSEHIADPNIFLSDLIIAAFPFDIHRGEESKMWSYLHTAWQEHYLSCLRKDFITALNEHTITTYIGKCYSRQDVVIIYYHANLKPSITVDYNYRNDLGARVKDSVILNLYDVMYAYNNLTDPSL